MAYWKYIALMF